MNGHSTQKCLQKPDYRFPAASAGPPLISGALKQGVSNIDEAPK